MANLFKSVKKLSFIEIYFKLISLLYWPIYWYKWIVITIENYNLMLFNIYLVVDGIFIFMLIISLFRKSKMSKNYFAFQIITAITYLISLYSLMIYPTNVILLYTKMSLCVILMVVSWRIIRKEYNDIGVVGLLAGLLILVLTYFY